MRKRHSLAFVYPIRDAVQSRKVPSPICYEYELHGARCGGDQIVLPI
jgi:hypothetical protein